MTLLAELVPRDYQTEAFERAVTENVIMVGDTGVGKTLVAILLIQDFFRKNARPSVVNSTRISHTSDSTGHVRWAVFLAPTQQLVKQQSERIASFTGLPSQYYIGKELDKWAEPDWQKQFRLNDVLVMTPGAMLNIISRGRSFLSLEDIGIVVMDECHGARKRHPYAQIMSFYDIIPADRPKPRIFGMTASPRAECFEVMRCVPYICDPERSDVYRYAAVPETSFFMYSTDAVSTVDSFRTLNRIFKVAFDDGMFYPFPECKIKDIVQDIHISLKELGLWCAVRHAILVLENAFEKEFISYRSQPQRADRIRAMLKYVVDSLERTVRNSTREIEGLPSMMCRLCSSKVLELAKILLQYGPKYIPEKTELNRNGDFRCMVFVEKRVTAKVICNLLRLVYGPESMNEIQNEKRKRPVLKCGYVIGGTLASTFMTRQASESNYWKRFDTSSSMNDFKQGKLQMLVTTDACSEGIDVPECGLVISLDPFKHTRQLMHTRGRTRAIGGKFCVLVPDSGPDRVKLEKMLSDAELVRRNNLAHETKCNVSPLRVLFPDIIAFFPSSGATLDLDMAVSVLNDVEQLLGLPPTHYAYETCQNSKIVCTARLPTCLIPVVEHIKPQQIEIPMSENKSTVENGSNLKSQQHFENKYAGVLDPGFKFPCCATKREAKAIAAFIACCQLHRNRILSDHLTIHSPSKRISLNCYMGFDYFLQPDTSKVNIPAPNRSLLGLHSISDIPKSAEKVLFYLYALQFQAFSGRASTLVDPHPMGIISRTPLSIDVLECCRKNKFSMSIGNMPLFLTCEQINVLCRCHMALSNFACSPKSVLIENFVESSKKFEPNVEFDNGYCIAPLFFNKLEHFIDWEAVLHISNWEYEDGGKSLNRDLFLGKESFSSWRERLDGESLVVRTREKRSSLSRNFYYKNYIVRRNPSKITLSEYMEQAKKIGTGKGPIFVRLDEDQLVLAKLPYFISDEVYGSLDSSKLLSLAIQLPTSESFFNQIIRPSLGFNSPSNKETVDIDDEEENEELAFEGVSNPNVGSNFDALLEGEEIFYLGEKYKNLESGKHQISSQMETISGIDEMKCIEKKSKNANPEIGHLSSQLRPELGTDVKMIINQEFLNRGNELNQGISSFQFVSNLNTITEMVVDQDDSNQNSGPPQDLTSSQTSRNGKTILNQGDLYHKLGSNQTLCSSRIGLDSTKKWNILIKKFSEDNKPIPFLLLVPNFQCIKKEQLPLSIVIGAFCALPMCFGLERALLASNLRKTALLPCSVSAVETALRRPANERLETLGDAWLKFYSSLVVMQVQPLLLEEGLITDFRTNIICNARLTKTAKNSGLMPYIHPPRSMLGRPYIENWSPSFLPPKSNMVSWKVPADCVEALIGTCLLCGGESGPQALLKYLELPLLPGYVNEIDHTSNKIELDDATLRALNASKQGFWALGDDNALSNLLQKLPKGAFLKQQYSELKPTLFLVQSLKALEVTLGYNFRCKWLVLEALTHASYTTMESGTVWPCEGGKTLQVSDYQRLEVLGDAILCYLVTTQLYLCEDEYKTDSPQTISEGVARCVSNSTFGIVAAKCLKLESHIRCAPSMVVAIEAFSTEISNSGSQSSKEFDPPKALADVFEALVAAIYVDSGFSMDAVNRIFWPLLKNYAYRTSTLRNTKEKKEAVVSKAARKTNGPNSASLAYTELPGYIQTDLSLIGRLLRGSHIKS